MVDDEYSERDDDSIICSVHPSASDHGGGGKTNHL